MKVSCQQSIISISTYKFMFSDESSIGSKLMAKMGWNKGDGLGKEQHGSVDFIQVRYKNNANGLGFNGLKDDQVGKVAIKKFIFRDSHDQVFTFVSHFSGQKTNPVSMIF